MRIPSSYLPSNLSDIKNLLNEYFQTPLEFEIRLDGDFWNIHPSWPTRYDYYVDPYLTEAMQGWRKGARAVDIPNERRLFKHGAIICQLSLFHSWFAHLWSLWLSQERPFPKEAVIIHVDSHADLLRPLLGMSSKSLWTDLVTHRPVALADPQSVERAIVSGAISIGNFGSALFCSGINIHYYHMYNPFFEINQRPDTIYRVNLENFPDNLNPQFLCVAVAMTDPSTDNAQFLLAPYSTYLASATLEKMSSLSNMELPVFLDIDLDYFNNRYNWDNEWKRKNYFDPSLLQVFDQIDGFFTDPLLTKIHRQIRAINVSLSPAFFPSEYWELIIPEIELQLQRFCR